MSKLFYLCCFSLCCLACSKSHVLYSDKGVFHLNDKSFNFISSEDSRLDTVFGVYQKISKNKYYVKSFYQENTIESFVVNESASNFSDSVFISLSRSGSFDYPFMFVSLEVMNNKNDTLIVFPFQTQKISKNDLETFSLQILGAKSSYFNFYDHEIPDTLELDFDYLYPLDIRKYTFLNDTLCLVKKEKRSSE